jgi:RNA polymerase sigma factor (sigma-70 family)
MDQQEGVEISKMKITAITRYKHGELYAILQRIGWNQSELARKTGLSNSVIRDTINLVRRPTAEQADAIQKAIGAAGEYLDVLSEWPETFAGLKRGYKFQQTAEVEMDRLLDHPEALQIAAPEYKDNDELHECLESLISKMPNQIQIVLRERFWNGKTHEEIGDEVNVSRGRVQQIESKALRMLRHPTCIRKLRELDGVNE